MKFRPAIFRLDKLLPPGCRERAWTLEVGEEPLDPIRLFEAAYGMLPPQAVALARPAPVERVWLPGPDVRPIAGARILSRHPHFVWCSSDVPVTPVGRSPRSTPRGYQHRVPSLASGRTVRAASTNEYHAVIRAEIDPAVDNFVEQPVWLRFEFEGRAARTRPDLFLAGLHEFWEVKEEAEACRLESRFHAIGTAFAGLGYGYRVMTEEHLRHSRAAQTVGAIYADRRALKPTDERLAALRRALVNGRTMSVGEIVAMFPDLDARQVHGLICHRFLRAVTLDAPLDRDFRVRFRGRHVTWTDRAGE